MAVASDFVAEGMIHTTARDVPVLSFATRLHGMTETSGQVVHSTRRASPHSDAQSFLKIKTVLMRLIMFEATGRRDVIGLLLQAQQTLSVGCTAPHTSDQSFLSL
jgi:hypothetical protein